MNKNYGQFGYAIQTARGTAAAAPTVSFYASDDSDGINSEKSLETLNLTIGGKSTAVDTYTDEVEVSMETTTLAFPDMTGLLLAAAMGADTVTGSGPYVHTITAGEELPYITATEQKGARNAALRRMTDAKVDELTINAEGVAPISIEATLAGCDAKWLAATSWNGPTFDIDDGYYSLANAEVLFSLSTDTPGAVPAGVNLESLEIGIANNVEATRALGSAVPLDQVEQTQSISVTISGTTDSTALYREVITGAAAGTDIATAVVTGSLQITFPHNTDADQSLVIKVPAIPWECEVPAVSTDGGPFELSLSTDDALAVDGTAATFIVTNGTASYLS